MKSIIILLVAVGVAVADVSELVNRYLPPALVQNAIVEDFSVTEAPEASTTPASTTVVEIEQVPLDEMHYEEQQQQQVVPTTEQPTLSTIYEQPPAFIYEVPIITKAQTEAVVVPAGDESSRPAEVPVATEVPIAPVAPEAPIAPVAPEAPIAPVAPEAPIAPVVPIVEEVIVIADIPIAEEAPITEEAVVSEAPKDIAADLVPDSVAAPIAIVDETPIVKEAEVEIPIVEAEPKPAHVLDKDGYRYKTANHFRYRF